MNTETIFRAYASCAIWADLRDEDGDSLDHAYDLTDIAPEAATEMREELRSFLADESIADALQFWADHLGEEQIGYDFYLTRNRHGAGFWDRFGGDTEGARFGRVLTDAAHPYGEACPYVGDDGLIYVS